MPLVSAVPVAQLKVWANAYFNPVEAFNSSKKDANFGAIAVHLVLIGLLAWVASMLSAVVGMNFLLLGIGIMGIIVMPITVLLFGFIGSAIYFVIAKIFGGKGGYMEQTLALTLIYGGAVVLGFPFNVLSGIPLLGGIFGIIVSLIGLYNLYNLYLVTREVHSLSSTKAILVVLVPIILAVIVAFVFAAAMAAMLGASALGAAAGTGGFGY